MSIVPPQQQQQQQAANFAFSARCVRHRAPKGDCGDQNTRSGLRLDLDFHSLAFLEANLPPPRRPELISERLAGAPAAAAGASVRRIGRPFDWWSVGTTIRNLCALFSLIIYLHGQPPGFGRGRNQPASQRATTRGQTFRSDLPNHFRFRSPFRSVFAFVFGRR